MNHHFSHTIPQNSKKIWLAFLSLVITLGLCVLAYTISMIFWDDYTYQAYSLRYGVNVTAGWPATLSGWSLWLGIAIIVVLPLIYFMQDWKNPSLGLSPEGLFINQQMIRNVAVPLSNIRQIEKLEQGYRLTFKDNSLLLSKVGFFKPMVKYNLENGGFSPTDNDSGVLDQFFAAVAGKAGLMITAGKTDLGLQSKS